MDLDYILALNAAIYASLAVGLLQRRRQHLVLPPDPVAAFRLLESTVKRAFPDLEEGFTWREAISRAHGVRPDLDWDEIQEDVKTYEAFRYGGAPVPQSPRHGILRLVKALRSVR